jgi:hypothetical protein
MSLLRAFSLALFLCTTPAAAFAGEAQAPEKMSVETHDLVIGKLERSLRSATEDATLSLQPVRARLADLYADRARLRAMAEAESDCQERNACSGARDDRARALKLYEIVAGEAAQKDKGPLFLQMAHLHRLNGAPAAADALIERIIREGSSRHAKSVLGEAYRARAERLFARGQYREAQKEFEESRKLVGESQRGPIQHRIAWCLLNQGADDRAVATLIQILKEPSLLMRESTTGLILDTTFQDDVSHDLATFLARSPIGRDEVQLIENLSSDRVRRDNIKHLAQESERLGRKRAALTAWDAFLENASDGDRLEVLVRVARIRFDLGEKEGAFKTMGEAALHWKKKGCPAESSCDSLRLHLRRLVTDWNRAETKKPSALLFDSYRIYLSVFSDDAEMTFWAASVARQLDRRGEAIKLYHDSADLAARAKNKDTPEGRERLEASLVGEIEMAELEKKGSTGRNQLAFTNLESAYDHYLALNAAGAIAQKVRYQRARLAYERSDWREAVKRLEAFATAPDCLTSRHSDLCEKAADLDLDARVALKDHRSIETAAFAYARAYPTRAVEYRRIARTAVMKQVETMEPKSALEKLAGLDLTGADRGERVRLLKTRMAIAEKAKDLGAVKISARELLATPGLTMDDREAALSRWAWAAEMTFDFEEAYRVSAGMKMAQMKPADRELRLAALAELAGRSSRTHDERYLELAGHGPKGLAQRAFVRAKRVRLASSPRAEWRRQEPELLRVPSIAAPLALEVYARTKDRSFAERALSQGGAAFRREAAAQLLARHLFLEDFSRLDAKVAATEIHTESEGLLQTSLARRLGLIANLESAANRAISSRDSLAQAIALTSVARENKRLASELPELPVPRRLKGREREAYVKAIATKAQGFQNKARSIEEKLALLWGSEAIFEGLTESAQAIAPATRKLLGEDWLLASKLAPSSPRRKIEREIDRESWEKAPDASALASSWNSARKNPFDERPLTRLRDLEFVRGHVAIVGYLDARLTTLREGSLK